MSRNPLSGSSLILTAYSTTAPDPPMESAPSLNVISSTPRYTSGQSLLLSSTSAEQKCFLFSRVLKSRKPRFTGFLTLYT